ncbi:MAG: hypothetical protein M0R00_00485 [Candidatus Omnitrophica bacterium]|jgi:transcriptional regulator with XRE-family HTH domain|nr:hypothetical protein [Candidatus Omnitrophota bacterium]
MENKIRLKLGRKIEELRRKSGYTQEKLAEMAEIDYKYLQISGTGPENRGLSPPSVNCQL